MVVSFFILTVVVWTIIQLPPGDFLERYVTNLARYQGGSFSDAELAALRVSFGLDGSQVERYLRWLGRFLRGDLGMSMEWGGGYPVKKLLSERLPYTVLISLTTLVFAYAVAIPAGIYSATRQYTMGDYAISIVGFLGMATPSFMLALVLLYLFLKYFGISAGGLFSPGYAMAPWSPGKVWDLVKHLWVPVIVVGTAATAGTIRVMRGVLLDELGQQYVITARAKGLSERKLLFKYPVRLALNPIVSTIGWQLPAIVSGETVVSIVLNLPTTGPLIYQSLRSQDMFMAASIIMLLSILTMIGTLISDLLLVTVDPRIRFER